jgi:hypothetical protein
MASALEGFLAMECDDALAGWLRGEVAASAGSGYDRFELNLFDLELFYSEDRVTIAEAVPLGYDDVELTLTAFLAAIPAVPPGPRMPGRPRRVIAPPPPTD